MARRLVSGTTREALASPEQVSEFLGVSVKTLYHWRRMHMGPTAHGVGRHLRYRWSDVDDWLDAHRT